MKLETLAVHAGYSPDPTTRAVAVPIYQTTSYAFDDTQHGADLFDLKVPGNIYTRIMNPTTDVLEQRVAALEGGVAALAVASGMAAITYAIQTIAEVGDNIVSVAKLYGGTFNLFAHTLPRQGIEVRFAAHDDIAALESLIDERTAKILAERSRRAEAEEANRLADEAVWRANLQRRRKNEAAASRAPGRAALHEEEKRRLQPFIDMYKKQYDGKIENAALGNKVGDIGVNTSAYDADLGDPTRAADAPPHRVTLT